jgi:hypothetical protein
LPRKTGKILSNEGFCLIFGSRLPAFVLDFGFRSRFLTAGSGQGLGVLIYIQVFGFNGFNNSLKVLINRHKQYPLDIFRLN